MSTRPIRSADRCPTHPGAFLREVVLPVVHKSRVEIASALGVSRQTLHKLVKEQQPVTADLAVRLGTAFDTSPASWMAMQAAHDLWHAARSIPADRAPRPRELADA